MTTAWEVAPPNPQFGAETPLLILDREDGPEGRTICVIPGNLSRRVGDGDFVRLLDEQQPDLARRALEHAWDEPVRVRPSAWAMPAGAFGDSAGPI